MGRKTSRKKLPATRSPHPGARISLCMIVRDEAEMLPACLASVEDAVDEIVVVDTGSRDETRAIAVGAGAIVVERPWDDDFAAPRNLGIATATGDWILVLDADERLARGAAGAIRRAVGRDDFDCGILPLHNAARPDADVEAVRRGRGRASEVAYLPRLLRKGDDLAFEGVIHENVIGWLFRTQARTRVLTGADIVHLGYTASVQQARRKHERDVALLDKAIAAHPDDPSYYGYLALSYQDANPVPRAAEVAEAGWSRLGSPARGTEVVALRLAVARAAAALDRGDYDTALESVAVGQRHWADHPDLWFLHGCAAEALVLEAQTPEERSLWIEEATRAFGQARAQQSGFFVQRFLTGATTWATSLRLATLHLMVQRPKEALEAYDRARAEGAPADLCALGRAECQLSLGHPRRALRLLDEQRQRRGEARRADASLLAALAAEQEGDLATMGKLLVETRRRLGQDFASIHRRELFFDAVAAMALHHGEAADAPGPFGQLSALLQGQARPVKGGLARTGDLGMMQRLLRSLIRRGHADALGHLLDPRAEAFLPGIGATLRAVVDDLGRNASAAE